MPLAFLRLAFADLRRRLLPTALTLVAVAVAAATLTLTLAISDVARGPWQQTFEATNGPHVQAISIGAADLSSLKDQPGVAQASGPFPFLLTSFRFEGKDFGLRLEGRAQEPPVVDRPAVSSGTWLQTGGVVFERSFARALNLKTGDLVEVATTDGMITLRVSGIAVTSTQESYPLSRPGLAWALPETIERIQPDATRWGSTVLLRLDNPENSGDFIQRTETGFGPGVIMDDWHELRADATSKTRRNEIILGTFSLLLALALGFILSTTISGRVLAERRKIGLLKAVGFTPRQVSAVFLLEQLGLGALAAILGSIAGLFAAPLFVSYASEVLGSPPRPGFEPGRFALTLLVVEAVIALFTFLSAWLSARRRTVEVLNPSPPRGRSRLSAAAARLGLPAAVRVGVKDAFLPRGRGILTTLSLVLTVAAVVATLAMEASLRIEESPVIEGAPRPASVAEGGLPQTMEEVGPHGDAAGLRPLVYGLDAALLLVAAANLLTTTLLLVRERVRDLGILRALGFTPRQVVASVVSTTSVLGVAAVVLGIPLGIGLFRLVYRLTNGSSTGAVTPAWWWLVLVVPGTLALVGLLGGLAARRASSIQVVEALRYE